MPPKMPEELSKDLMFLLNQASFALTAELATALAGLGISPREYCVLTTAAEQELTQSQLAELCALDKTTMVVTVDSLERSELAERVPSPADRRARVIRVTPTGREVVDTARGLVDRVYAEVLGGLPDRERRTFVGNLVRLVTGRLATPSHVERPVRRRTPRAVNVVP